MRVRGGAAPPADDATVIAASLDDPDRFAQVYEKHAGKLYGYAYRRVGREIAEDVVADAFVAAFRARHTYDPGYPNAFPWLLAIVHRELARHHRAENARYRAYLRVKPDSGEEAFADRVAASASAQAWRRPLAAALARLGRKERDVLLLVAWGDLSYEEVARALDIPVGTVRSRLNRARRRMRDTLDADPDRSGSAGNGIEDRRWSLGLAGGVLAALLVVVTVGPLVRHGWPAGGSAPPPGTAEAAEILRTAALVAHEADLPVPRAGQFVFTETVASPINQVQQPDGGFSTAQGPRVLRQTWLSADGTRDGLVRDRPYQQDLAASDELVLPACPAVSSADAVSGRPCTPQPGFDAGMPDSPAAVLDWLRAGVSSAAGPQVASAAAPGGGVADALVFQRAGELLVGGRYLTPGQRSALFTALASLPGMTVRQQVRDLANRPGVGVGLADGTTLIFDATSYAFLGTTNSALLRQATVDELGDIPP